MVARLNLSMAPEYNLHNDNEGNHQSGYNSREKYP